MQTTGKGSHPVQPALAHSRQKASSSSGEVTVREECGMGRVLRLVRQERSAVPVPSALKAVLNRLHITCNTVYDLDARGEITETRPSGRVLVIAPHREASLCRGIVGIPGTGAEMKRLRKQGFTHMTIDCLPEACRHEAAGPHTEGYDERGFALRFYQPKSGRQREGEMGGEMVHEVVDELSALEWIYENGLAELFAVKTLIVEGLLPKTDEQREEENAAAIRNMQMWTPHMPKSFHAHRLLARYRALCLANVDEADEVGRASAIARADKMFAASAIGKQRAAHSLIDTP